MARDPYKILGVSRDADDDQIRRAYRRLAKQEHPDAHGGDEDYFCRLNDAYEQLRTPERRRKCRRQEQRARGRDSPRPRSAYGDPADDLRSARRSSRGGFSGRGAWPFGSTEPGGGAGGLFGSGGLFGFAGGGIFDALERMFGRAAAPGLGGHRQRSGRPGRERTTGAGRSFEASVRLSPREAARGVTLEVQLPEGKRRLDIPAGVNDRDVLSYRELDENGRPVGVELEVYVD